MNKKRTERDCKCGCQYVEYLTVIAKSGREYMAWVCTRCGRERSIYK